MKKGIIAILLLAVSLSAFSQTTTTDDLITVITNKDSTKEITITTRGVNKIVVYDSVTKKDVISVDTVWGRRYFVPIIDPKTKKQLIEKGQPKFDPNPRYIIVSKDSVRWKGIEGVPTSKLLDKKVPPRGN